MDKLSTRQAGFLLFTMILSPAVRLFSAYLSGPENQSGWLGVLPAGALMLLLILLLCFLQKRCCGLSAAATSVLGKTGGKILLVLYALWALVMTAAHLRYCGERMVSTVYADSYPWLFSLLTAIICALAVWRGLRVTARMNEIILPLLLVLLAGLLLLMLPQADFENLLPLDSPSAMLNVGFCAFSNFAYVTVLFFFLPGMSPRVKWKKTALITGGIVTAVSMLILAFVIAVLGFYVTDKLSYPFFAAVKQISVGKFLQHMEAGAVCLWMLSDFVLIAVLACMAASCVRDVLGKPDSCSWLSPAAVGAAFLLSLAPPTGFAMEKLSRFWLLPANCIMLFLVPLILLAVGKLRRVL